MNDKKKLFKNESSVLEDALVEDLTEQTKLNGDERITFEDVTDSVIDVTDVEAENYIVSGEEEVITNLEETAQKENAKNRIYLTIYDLIGSIMGAFIIITLIFVFVFRLVGVDGESMTNTLQHGDWVLTANKSEYVQGDIIVITQDTYFHKPLIKRVIAVGGQTVDIDYATATVYVDGVALDEPYVKEDFLIEKYDYREFPYTVPEGTLFCMGDNRNGSSDSRTELVGPIDERQVLGKAVIRLFPMGKADIYDYE